MSTVFLKLVNMSITAGWLILAVILARLLLKKAPKWISCLLWGLVAVRLICPFSFESIFSLIPSSETIPLNIAVRNEPQIKTGITFVNDLVNPVIERAVTPASETGVPTLQDILPAAAAVWAIGTLIMLAYALISYLRLKKMVSICVPVGERIYACDEVKSPFILGIGNPAIYVPSSLGGETLAHVIRHENAHLQRRDHWWKPLGFLLLAVYWFHPLCWVAYILLCRDIELACDEKVIRDMDKADMAAYSQALLDCSFPRRRIVACPLAFGEVGVKERVEGVLNYKKPAFWVILIALVVCAVLAVCLLTNPSARLSEKLAVSMDMAVAGHNQSGKSEGHYCVTDYDVLKISKSGNETTVYAWVLWEEYSFDGQEVKLESGSHVPTVITFDTSDDRSDVSAYPVLEYWEPRDGKYYAEDVRNKFPLSIRGRISDDSEYKAQHENCLRAAREYYRLNPASMGVMSRDEETWGWGENSPEYFELNTGTGLEVSGWEMGKDVEALREACPEYFDLDTGKGLEVYVWQMAPSSYSFGILPGTNREKTLTELINLKGVRAEDMKTILSTYDIDEKNIFIIPWQNPISSYIGECWIIEKDEDPALLADRQQAYVDKIRGMLFDTN